MKQIMDQQAGELNYGVGELGYGAGGLD